MTISKLASGKFSAINGFIPEVIFSSFELQAINTKSKLSNKICFMFFTKFKEQKVFRSKTSLVVYPNQRHSLSILQLSWFEHAQLAMLNHMLYKGKSHLNTRSKDLPISGCF